MGDSLNQKLNVRINNDENQLKIGESSKSGMTNSNNNNPNSKYQLLKQKKLDLEKRLNEKYNQLQQVCREEAQIIGVYPVDFGCTDPSSQNNTLRRRVGTSFKLPENLLSNGEDDINKLLLEKQIQLQICEASLRLASDQTLSKSAVRTHKQNYESAQQKLLSINQNISKLRKLQNAKPIQQTQDDINIHKSPDSSPHVLNMVDRRNLTKSNSVTNSPSTSHKQAPFATPQPRTRHDSIGTNPYEKMSPISPTTGYQSFNQNYQQQLQHLSPHYHYSSAATISGYSQSSSRKSPSLSYVAARPQQQHYHHNTMPLRQLNSSPMRQSQTIDTNGNTDGYFNYEPPSRPESSLVDRIESVQQAPGGYWLSMANNERVWFPLDNKFSSLDRRNLAKKPLIGHQAKSTSMGNIDFAVDSDAISVTSGSSEQKRREKTWQETSLDEPEPLPPRAPPPQSPMKKVPIYKHPDDSSDIENANIPPKLAPRAQKLVRAPSLEPTFLMAVKPAAATPVPEIIERPASVMIPQMIPISPTNSLYSPDSPNVTIVQQGKIQPYKEEEKPFEMSDFYKYSTKFRQKQMANNQQSNNNCNSKSG